ncbi:MAG: SpoIIE family protein phosphatase [Clostridia bacterium]|nr:SpoIIE family protein phosphatase [Clostridia bacterium]MBR3152214.1 SpoIIE family protein phosphatase [Clostridia bacterium]MBR3152249.1 SpoIIE family protein phosphatase [Clostridia bacterium]
MFQNLAEEIMQKKEDVKFNKIKTNLIGRVFKIQNIIVYILSFLISTVKVDDSIAPFGMAMFAAACGSKIPAGVVLASTMAATLISFGVNELLTYSLTVLVFVLSVIVLKPRIEDDRNERGKLGKNVIFSILVVQAIRIFTGTVLVYDIVFVVVTAIMTYIFYKIFVNSLNVIEEIKTKRAFTIEEIIGATVFISIAAVSLSEFRIYGLSVSNIIAIFLILVLGWRNGILVGSTAGVSIGMVLGVIGVVTPLQILSFAISGLISGALSRFGKFGVAFGFLIGNTVLSYISTGTTIQILQFQEILIASVGLIFVPKYVEINIESIIGTTKLLAPPIDNGLSEKRDLSFKLKNISSTITEMIKSYGITEEDKIIEELEGINTSREMFVEDFLNNIDAFPNNFLYEDLVDVQNGLIEDIYVTIVKQGEISENDLIKIFEKRNNFIIDDQDNDLIRMDVEQIVRIANRTYKVNELNFSWKKKLQENKTTISKAMKGVSKAITDIAEDISKPKETEFKEKEKIITQTLSQKGISIIDIKMRQNRVGKYFIDLFLENDITKDEIRFIENIFTKVCNERIIFRKDSKHLDLENYMQKYSSEDKYTVQIGVSKVAKSGNNISGDSDIQIKLDDDKYLLSISDGMGSGQEARKSSQIVVRMLKKLLSAGFEKNDSLELINSTIKLSNEEIYATMDTAILDLYSGQVEFIKNGAVNTFIKNDKNIDEVISNSLPLGILNSVDFTACDKEIKDGDIIVMCSDGIIDSNQESDDDKWFVKLLKNVHTNNVQRMADIILNEAIDNNYGIAKDDMTVIVAKIGLKKN